MIDINTINLGHGRTGCAMQWVEAMRLARKGREVTREKVATLTDASPCVSPVIGAFVRAWNDAMPDEARTRLLAPLLPLLLDTATGDDDDERRVWMAADWLVRVHVPAWLDLTPSLAGHAQALRALPKLHSRAAARAAAGAAALDAALDAALAAGRDAALDAARAAALAAALDAALDAAWDAALAAGRDAGRDAARDALSPTTATLQVSAADLLRRMCEVGQ
jgi:hypothetical protein